MGEQIMKFLALYQNNREAVARALTSMWCGEVNNESQEAYVKQIKEKITDMFAPKQAIPVVQCVNRYKTTEHTVSEVENLIGNLWRTAIYNPEHPDRYFQPYEHQYISWETLLRGKTKDNKPMSICVTTGTGSGKTECFMLPLVNDLTEQFRADQTQAIFLYPLNALMEDQKERMEKILAGTSLKYAVYNGDLPEEEPDPDDNSKRAERRRRKIENIRGIERDRDGNYIRDEETGEVIQKYKHIIATRKELRDHPANILLTNPTMLEYILLRKKDERLIDPDLHSLRWVAIDETHTYTGAGAAELAMLIRRVLLAFDVKASDIRFSTSSATLGNISSIVDKEEREKVKAEQEKELKEFISKITGLEDKNQIKIIDGDPTNVEVLYTLPQAKQWRMLIENEYVELNKLFPDESCIEDQLRKLDEMCDHEQVPRDGSVRVKVHYFYHSPNGGFYVKLSQHDNGSFKVYLENNADSTDGAPMLELSRCKSCGEFVAIGEVDEQKETYQPLTMDDSDMFDLDTTDNDKKKLFIFGLTDKPLVKGDDNISISVSGNKYSVQKTCDNVGWHAIANTQCKCPYCGSKLTRKALGTDETGESDIEEDNKKLMKFRVSTDFIARLLAPSILDQLVEHEVEDGTIQMHKGQQYISFVDSRQAAAKSTMKQNLEEERLWVYSKIYHELCKRKLAGKTVRETIEELDRKSMDTSLSLQERMAVYGRITELSAMNPDETLPNDDKGYLTWPEITHLLESDDIADIYAYQFAKRTQGSIEVDINGNVSPLSKHKYVQSIMIECLGVRPKSSKAPETMGLFTTCYPKLEDVLQMELPPEVKDFNAAVIRKGNVISREDWKDLMQVFLDYTVRSDQSVYLENRDDDPIDIFACTRFSTKKESRRPASMPDSRAKGKLSRIVSYLGKLLMEDGQYTSVKAAVQDNIPLIQGVINALWINLKDVLQLLEHSSHYDEESRQYEKDKKLKDKKTGEELTPYRLNLAKLSFKLYDHVALCDTNTNEGVRHVPCFRPVGTIFKKFSPYIIDGREPERIDTKLEEEWDTYPYFYGSNHGEPTEIEIKEWAKEKRKLLWESQLWGEDGIIADYLLDIHKYPNLFVQAEHTAQVDKMVAREVQQNFKKHNINVLACSTTMEMGVDLGDLEVVMMTSVPPMPANYKQRAGRSGRNNLVRSSSITLCGSDAVGMRTLYNPMDNIIGRRVSSPTVDLNSSQVIQRHVNAFLIREFGVFAMGDHAGSINQKVIDFYTKYHFVHEGKHVRVERKDDGKIMDPTDGLGDYEETPYETFNNICLNGLSNDLRNNLTVLLRGTVFEGRVKYVVEKAHENNQRCRDELQMMIEDLKDSYKNATTDKQKNFYMMKYIEPLDHQLLSYWATHRFTPNANMPVNVCQFSVDGDMGYYSSDDASSNPSYPLREALSQYAPGNAVVIDGRVTAVRGVRYNDLYKRIVTLKKIYRNDEQTVIDNAAEISGKIKWPVTMTDAVELLQPTEFVPDMNETDTRILDKNVYTRVNAQLIGAAKWPDIVTEPHLFTARSNRECGNASILYYNEGIGYGYCHCTNCGRTVLETCAALSQDDPEELPADMNTISHKTDPDKPDYHYKLQGKDNRAFCGGSYDKKYIHRNVVLGDVIQTDYTEIRIRHLGKSWIAKRTEDNQNLLITLGLLFASALADLLGKERTAIDMTITPNGHICIFDTNPGGSGYSNQLAEMQNMKEVLHKSMEIIKLAEDKHSRDALLDKFTLHYIDNLDIEAAKAWLEEEAESRRELPAEVKAISENASETSLAGLIRAYHENNQACVLFADNDYKTWNYGGSEYGWRGHLLNYFSKMGSLATFCILKTSQQYMNNPLKDMARDIKAWTNSVVEKDNPYNNIYPLAYINGILYFTNSKENASLNDHWGNGTMYSAKVDFNISDATPLNMEYVPGTINAYLYKREINKKRTNEIGGLILKEGESIINEFKSHCDNSNEPLTVVYQDDYLRSVLSMVISLQTIGQILEKIGKSFSIEYLMERYEEYSAPQNIWAPFRNSSIRNARLTEYTGEWLSGLGLRGVLTPIVSKEPRSLTHWRELSIKCSNKTLHIYPDGGFANGWHFDKYAANQNNEFYYQDDTLITDNIPVYLGEDIKIGFAITEE